MKPLHFASVWSEQKGRSFIYSIFIVVSMICAVYFIGGAFISEEYRERLARWEVMETLWNGKSKTCKDQCRPPGSEALPQAIVTKTSNLEMRPLWGSTVEDNRNLSMNLLAIAVGIKQKEVVDRIVKKFPASDFVVMLFHYDGVVDQWSDLTWSDRAIHVSAGNQTKWWFAKRFLHPDILAEYDYVFLWDEDIGVDNFDPRRYLLIVKDEGLEISQPALDPKSNVHYQLAIRQRKSNVHRRMYKFKGSGRCDDHSTAPPCTGWVEMMAPVFSRAAWRCAWYMIQNDLIHAWGLDKLLGYCAQGDRTKNVGVVDSEYIFHLGLPTLGTLDGHETPSNSSKIDNRPEVRKQSYIEMQIFNNRWNKAVKGDQCWIDPYQVSANQSIH
ncbi:uncharacterized protein LOC120003348 isoform X2 [Tripterygium wilfordii]|uniref:uncharacterized protein LOC120003348 isoform X2 n=1 Tax=Tripterygium wilfordii TaxID=458696 RepID=UPI0018F7E99A|nr:uncharacterized protein LOC120003348 isoform X2 [Tripterygium wilfordii]